MYEHCPQLDPLEIGVRPARLAFLKGHQEALSKKLLMSASKIQQHRAR